MTETGPAGPSTGKVVNAVFKGGGAKGVAYAGAIRAMEERGYTFGSVAGTSAGAITAALLAAGLSADELSEAVPEGLASIRSSMVVRLGKAVIGHATSLFDSTGLRAWLNGRLASAIGADPSQPVTFRQLTEHTGIELYIVAMDLADGLPVIFTRRTTPNAEVAGAVASSSAIPGALPPGRAVYRGEQGGLLVHQLVDGGTWANYPAFVFRDSSFRAWLRAEGTLHVDWDADEQARWDAEASRPMIGCILGEPDSFDRRHPLDMVRSAGPKIDRRFDQGPTYTSRSPLNHTIGSLLSSDWARLMIGLALVASIALSISTLPIAVRRMASWLADWVPDSLFPIALVGVLALTFLSTIIALLVVALLVITGRLLADTMLPMLKAMMGVSTDVAPWVGRASDDVVLRVPYGELSTLSFDADGPTRDAAVEVARVSVGDQLDGRATAAQRAATTPLTPDRFSWQGAAALVLAAAALGVLAWWVVDSATTMGIGLIVAFTVAGLVIGVGCLLAIAGQARERAWARSRAEVAAGWTGTTTLATVAIVLGVVATIGGLIIGGESVRASREGTTRVEVISALADDGGNVYAARPVDSPAGADDTVEFRSDRHLRLGEAVYVTTGSTGVRLAGPLDDGWIPVSIVLILLGLGVLTFGVRLRNWVVRCRRLALLAAPH